MQIRYLSVMIFKMSLVWANLSDFDVVLDILLHHVDPHVAEAVLRDSVALWLEGDI